MRIARVLVVIAGVAALVTGCVSPVKDVDVDLSLADAKARTQAVEREIAEALPSLLVRTVEQKKTGVFLPCSNDEGQQWAGGLTAQIQPGADAAAVLDPIVDHFSGNDDVAVTRREDEEDSLVDIEGIYRSAWVVRYDRETGDLRVTSFSPCIYLPDDVWPGDKY